MCRIILYHFTTYPKYPNPCVEGDVHCSRCNIVLIKLKYGPKCKHQHSGWANPQQNGSDFFLIDSYNIYIQYIYLYIHMWNLIRSLIVCPFSHYLLATPMLDGCACRFWGWIPSVFKHRRVGKVSIYG